MLQSNQIYLGDCLSVMQEIDDKSVDLTVTSPPYDNLRSYNNSLLWNEEIWKKIIKQLYRVTKDGGIVVWIVGDATINGSETGTSFKQALYAKECGFNLHDTMIYAKKNPIPLTHNRYEQQFEYMFVWSKYKPKVFNPIMEDCLTAGKKQTQRTFFQTPNSEERTAAHGSDIVKDKKQRYNIWFYSVGVTKGKGHPAPFPDDLSIDHIKSWSNEGDLVLDPFLGSGTTCLAAKNLNRQFIGIEKEEKYFNIAKERLNLC